MALATDTSALPRLDCATAKGFWDDELKTAEPRLKPAAAPA
jgi:hypothetical protein